MKSKQPEAFVYMWYDGNARKFYIGCHKGSPAGKYAHSSKLMESFTMNTIPTGFRRRILAQGTYDEMRELEVEYLCNRRVPINDKYHNLIIHAPRDLSDHQRKVKDGVKKARANGVQFGPKAKFTDEIAIEINKQYLNGDSIKDLMKNFDASRASIYRLLTVTSEDKSEFIMEKAGYEKDRAGKYITDKEGMYMKKLGYEKSSSGGWTRVGGATDGVER